MKSGKHESSKQRGQDLGWKVHDLGSISAALSGPVCVPPEAAAGNRAYPRSCTSFVFHSCMNYVITVFLLVSCMDTRNLLLYFCLFCQVLCTVNP